MCTSKYHKFILTITNLASLPSIYVAFNTGQIYKGILLSLATMFSMLHHAVETRFYGPALVNISSFSRLILFRCDQIFAVIPMVIVGGPDLLFDYYYYIIGLLMIMLLSNLVFYIKYFSLESQKNMMSIFHNPWHVGAFYLAYIAVTRYANSVTFYDMIIKNFL
jgi:hypothetical protein